jgi:hypothetical protein
LASARRGECREIRRIPDAGVPGKLLDSTVPMTSPLTRFAAQHRQVAEHEKTLLRLMYILDGLQRLRESPNLLELMRINRETTTTVERCLQVARDRLAVERQAFRLAVDAALRRHTKPLR